MAIDINEVYQYLDAVEAGLLDFLEPQPGGSGQYYRLLCPGCGKRRAYYYPGTKYVTCNRQNNCRTRESIADMVMQARGIDFSQARPIILEAAGYNTQSRQTEKAGEIATTRSLRRALEEVLQQQLRQNERARQYLADRGYPKDTRRHLPVVGYFPDSDTVDAELRKQDVDPEPLYRWGVLVSQDQRRQDGSHPMDGRIVVIWPAPNDWFFLCGRAIDDHVKPKSYYTPGADMTIPYGFRRHKRGVMWGIEGMFDRFALEVAGFGACALGSNAVNYSQASYIAELGIAEFGLVTDAGPAGIKGARDTINRLERLGVAVRIATVPPDSDDIDAVRQRDGDEGVERVVASAVTGGAYLANTLVTAIHRRPDRRNELHRQALQQARQLTLGSYNDFRRTFDRYGWSIETNPDEPIQLLGRLIDAGLSSEAAAQAVYKQHGVDLTPTLSAHEQEGADG